MVKVGFIVEGTSDFIILKSDRFQKYLKHALSIESSEELILIAHNKSNLKTNLKSYLSRLEKEVEYIFIMVDQDDKEAQKKNKKYSPQDCPIVVVSEIINFRDNRHYHKANHIYIVMTREFEAWLLADVNLGYTFVGLPEEVINPSQIIEEQEKTTNHVIIAKRVVEKFSLERAAQNAPSAKRFLTKLKQLNPEE
jgi:alkyl hydroperoxide reductase subunit AhpF